MPDLDLCEAVILKYRKPFIEWKLKHCSEEDETDPRDMVEKAGPLVCIFNRDIDQSYAQWLKKNYSRLFEEELREWERDKTRWPEKRTYAVFRKWFEVTFTPAILDLASSEKT